MRRRFRRRASEDPQELNVTCFMNLMVVLVPFLLMSAVFSEITIHDLNLPSIAAGGAEAKDNRPPLALEVVIRRDGLDVLDRNSGRLKLIPRTTAGYDFVALNQKLQQVKQSFPETTGVTLLLEPDVPYDNLIKTMDAVRSFEQSANGKPVKQALFPDVSIGDAPPARSSEDRP